MTMNEIGYRTDRDLDAASSPLIYTSDRAFWLGLATVLLSLISALFTFLILTGLTPITPVKSVVVGVLFVNVLLIAAMIAVISWQVAGLMRAWREKTAGARLHIRIVALFSVIAALPAILLAIGATVSFSRSLDSWFSQRIRLIINDSVSVANTYVNEHGQVIRNDVLNMARDIDAATKTVSDKPKKLHQLLISQAGLRDLPFAYIIDGNGEPIVKGLDDPKRPFARPTRAAIDEARADQVPLSLSDKTFRISAITKLKSLEDRFLYVGRPISKEVIRHQTRTAQNAQEYTHLRRNRGGLKWAHALMYLTISMTALLAAIWAGMWFAARFVAPIRRLITAAQLISKGDLQVALPERRGEGDLRRLSQTFNTMTRELKHQRDALVTANEQLLERRRFMEAVLSGVSAGVIGLDAKERVTLVSRSATDLLHVTEQELVGKKLDEVLPEFADVVSAESKASRYKKRKADEVSLSIVGEERTFAVRVTREQAGEGDVGLVVTFDDITELVSAQRTSAWADVARRIAHEIKNPLTPIILSVGRLRKNYAHVITEKQDLFEKLTTTIERQAGDIKTMVDEFAAFARMPDPQMASEDLRDAVQEPVILFRESHRHVSYDLSVPDHPIPVSIDRRLITQAITNLVKNATESVETAADSGSKPDGWVGAVNVSLEVDGDRAVIDVCDNGLGLPKQQRARLMEPYVTTKGNKGTGLGLAMVQKITEQHGGTVVLEDMHDDDPLRHGARVRLTLPASARNEDKAKREDEKTLTNREV